MGPKAVNIEFGTKRKRIEISFLKWIFNLNLIYLRSKIKPKSIISIFVQIISKLLLCKHQIFWSEYFKSIQLKYVVYGSGISRESVTNISSELQGGPSNG